ncbi:MAG: hypothetical protein J5382_06955 [Bacteroidales bacterium]|nr:hypothetical protein [Bacteroidales bacterium]
MKTQSIDKEQKYIAPEMEAIQITPGTVLNNSCSGDNFECISDGDECPKHENTW